MRLWLLSFVLLPLLSVGQTPDKISTKAGDLSIYPVLHGSVVFQWNGKTIFTDPYGGKDLYAAFGTPDLVFITDIHGDHLHFNTLDSLELSAETVLIGPKAVTDQLAEKNYKAKILTMANNETEEVMGIKVLALPMYNLPETTDSRHPKGRGNGYILNLKGTKVYVSGDTEDIPEMRNLQQIDVAFVCMNLPYTMDITQAASAVAAFQPRIVYPFHFRGKEGLSDVNAFKKLVAEATQNVEVRIRKWYPNQTE